MKNLPCSHLKKKNQKTKAFSVASIKKARRPTTLSVSEIEEISVRYDQMSLNELKSLNKEDVKQAEIPIVNSKITKKYIKFYSDTAEELFRESGSVATAKNLTAAYYNQLLTEVKDAHGNEALGGRKNLAAYAKLLLKNFPIDGTSKQSYHDAFNKIKDPIDKILFADLLDGIHYYGKLAKDKPTNKRTLSNLAISLRSLYVADTGPLGFKGMSTENALRVRAESLRTTTSTTPVAAIEDFLVNWSATKAELTQVTPLVENTIL